MEDILLQQILDILTASLTGIEADLADILTIVNGEVEENG